MKKFLSLLSMVLLAFSAFATSLPEGARIIAHGGSYDVFVVGNGPETDNPEMQPVSLWTYTRHNGEARCILTTHPDSQLDMASYSFNTPDQGKLVTEQAVMCVDHVWVHPNDESILVVSGIPDSRNFYTFIIDIENHTIMHLPSNSTFKGFTDEDGDILVESYCYYPQGGRYSLIAAYDIHGRRIGYMELVHLQP